MTIMCAVGSLLVQYAPWRLMASFQGTKLARGRSVRVGEMVMASLEFDMVYGERVRAWHV